MRCAYLFLSLFEPLIAPFVHKVNLLFLMQVIIKEQQVIPFKFDIFRLSHALYRLDFGHSCDLDPLRDETRQSRLVYLLFLSDLTIVLLAPLHNDYNEIRKIKHL